MSISPVYTAYPEESVYLQGKEAGADEAVIKLKSLEALEKVADGKATKIIIPSEIQNLAGLVTSIKEVATQPDPVEEADTTEE